MARRIRAGRMSHRVEVQKSNETRTDRGGLEKGWETVVFRWASIEPLSGRELWLAQQVQSQVSHRIRMRYLQGVKSLDRLKHGGRIFNIASVINVDEANRELELMTVEVI